MTKIMSLQIHLKVKEIHVSQNILNLIKLSAKEYIPMTDAVTGEIDENAIIYNGWLVLRDDGVDDIRVDYEHSLVEVGNE